MKTEFQQDIYTPKKKKKDIHTNVHHSIIHSRQETTQKSINRLMDKNDVVYRHNGILFSHKKGR